MNSAVVSTWNVPLIILSYVISVLGSFVALRAASLMRGPDGSISRVNTLAAGLAMGGIGVWSMHFIGMVALKLDVANGYSLVETLVSLVAAVGAASLAMLYVAKDSSSLKRMGVAGALLGVGVAVMHYLGMYGMRFGGYVAWNYTVVAGSVAIAMAAATAALWLAFNTPTLAFRVIAALVMGVAVCTMHYTGMAAADYVCTTADRLAFPQGFGVISSTQLPMLVTGVALGIGLLIFVDQVMQNMQAQQASDEGAAPR
jgi:NO-binding membrane sensor protein with MHYT domain